MNQRVATETRPIRNIYEMYACKVHASETHAYEIHDREMRARRVLACVEGVRLHM